jgi:tRNA(Ile)-lysidine synthase
MHPFEKKLAAELAKLGPARLLVAVSGGPDSIALFRAALATANGATDLAVGHFNHQLRPESADDEQFVRALCETLGVTCHVGRAETDLRSQTTGVGLEAAARTARYEFLGQVARELRIPYVLTAHTANDQAETVLHRVLRGTGLRGLKGIRPIRRLSDACQLVRPMLTVTRQEVQDYLQEICQPARLDSTNDQTLQTRNRIRNQLLPQLTCDYNPEVRAALVRLAGMASELEAVVEQVVSQAEADAVTLVDVGRVEIDVGPLTAALPYVIRQLLIRVWQRQSWPEREMDHAQWTIVERMIRHGEPKSRSLPGGVRAKRQGEQLVLTRPVES